jgi:hypothetical protein
MHTVSSREISHLKGGGGDEESLRASRETGLRWKRYKFNVSEERTASIFRVKEVKLSL